MENGCGIRIEDRNGKRACCIERYDALFILSAFLD